MCGRFTRKYTWRELWDLYRLTSPASNLEPRYNVCPTTEIDTVIMRRGERVLAPTRWGLVPAWWSKPLKELRAATFNARIETVLSRRVPAGPLPHSRIRLLRMAKHVGRQAAALLHGARRLAAPDHRRAMG
jgi:putative SOS response-associated peptidase YedK